MYYYAMEYNELVDSFKKVVTIEGQKILITLLADQIYAIKDQCIEILKNLTNYQTARQPCKNG